jgi:hypothetical protein
MGELLRLAERSSTVRTAAFPLFARRGGPRCVPRPRGDGFPRHCRKTLRTRCRIRGECDGERIRLSVEHVGLRFGAAPACVA